MFLTINIVICSILCIVSYYLTFSGIIGLASTCGPARRSLFLKKILYGFIVRVSILIYWFLFVQKFKILVSIITISSDVITLSIIFLSLVYTILNYLCESLIMSKREKNQ